MNTFYRSKAWVELINVLRLERVSKDGILYCEHCGKPIIKQYDCVAHHVTELTESNVNDINISLNPDNIKLVHFRCHNEIHKRFGHEKQRVYCVYGSPCSGKTSWVKENAGKDDLILDIDSIYQCISANERYIKSNRLSTNVFAIRDCLLEQIKMRSGKWINAFVVGGYPLLMERQRLQQRLGCEFVFIDTDKKTCLERAGERGEKWSEFVEEWSEKFQEDPPVL